MEKTTNIVKKSMRAVLIVLVIFILILLSFTMVKIVPRILSSMANATVSITSAFLPASKTNDSNQNTNSSKLDTTTSTVTLDDKNSSNNSSDSGSTTGGFLSKIFGKDENNNNDVNFVVSTSTRGNTTNNSNTNNSSSVNSNSKNSTNNTSGNTSSKNTYVQNGSPDLVAEILAIGTNNGNFVTTNNFQNTDTVVVKFKVENRGSANSSAWSLRVDMPSSNSNDKVRTISSRGIPAGMAVTGQAVFTSPMIGQNQIISISVDPNNYIAESNESNNQTSAKINVSQNYNSGYNNNYYNGYNNYNYNNYNNYYQNGQNLTVRLIAIGKMDSYNQFTATNYVRTSDRIAMKFEVINNGSNTTSNWNWKATLTGPNSYSSYNYNNYNNGYYNNGYYNNYYGNNYNYGAGYYYNYDGSRGYTNPNQEYGIAPNQTRTFTAIFENPMYGNNNFTINIDSSNNINEINENDNTISQVIFVNY